MNISQALANRMGASAEIIYKGFNLAKSSKVYPDIFVGFHDLLYARQWQLLVFKLFKVVYKVLNMLF
jgi:hypothetical protein